MMAADNMAAKPKSKEESQSSSSRKATTSQRPQEQALKCPRCDSANTKFCYYNNYSLTQPRHFCKTCRRYWTKGGALRNVPMGGGCRKNKKMKPSSSSKLSGDHSRDSSTSSDIGGLKFFHGFSSPAMDFQLGGLSFSRLQPSSTTGVYNNQFSSFGDISATTDAIASSPCFTLDPSGNTGPPLLGFNFPLPSLLKQGENSASFGGGVVQEMGSVNVHSNIASSIESLSSINQDMHWKLQQQRFAMLFGAENQKDHNSVSSSLPLENQIQKPQPILFQNLDISKAEEDCVAAAGNSRKEGTSNSNLATEWFFDNSYAPSVNPTPTNNSNANENGSSWNGVQAWSNLNQFSTLP